MFFWILLAFLILCIFFIVLGPILGILTRDVEIFGAVSGVALVCGLVPMIAVVGVWSEYSSDYSKVTSQQHRIEVYEERVESLESRLNQFNYPDKPAISLDADSPWASIIEALAKAETNLASAKDERATAIRSIEEWRVGPWSGIVTMVGDPIK